MASASFAANHCKGSDLSSEDVYNNHEGNLSDSEKHIIEFDTHADINWVKNE